MPALRAKPTRSLAPVSSSLVQPGLAAVSSARQDVCSGGEGRGRQDLEEDHDCGVGRRVA